MSKLLEYQELDKKLKKLGKDASFGGENVDAQNKIIKDCQTKILELEEKSAELSSTLDKLMEVQKKGIFYVQKCKNTNIDKMSAEELKDFEARVIQTAKQLSELSTRISRHSLEVKKVVLDYKMFRKKLLDAKEKRDSLKSQTAEVSQKSKPEIEEIKAKMAKLEKEIETSKLQKYRALKQDGIFPVIVPMIDNRCGGCRMVLSNATLDKLKTDGVCECEQCRRLIFENKK